MVSLMDLPTEVMGSIWEYLVSINEDNDLIIVSNSYSIDENVKRVISLSSVSRNLSELLEEKIRTFWRALVEKESLGKLNHMMEMMDNLLSNDLRRSMILLRKFRRLLRNNYNLKQLLVLGQDRVGKSKIIKEYISEKIWKPSDRNTSRVRAEIGDKVYHFDICDGIRGFSNVETLKYYMNTDAFILVLSLDRAVSNLKPFMEKLLETIEEMKSIRPLITPIVFVINKIDSEETLYSSVEDLRGLCQELIQNHKLSNTSIVENRSEQDICNIFSNIVEQLQWDDLLLEKIIELDMKIFHQVEEPKEDRIIEISEYDNIEGFVMEQQVNNHETKIEETIVHSSNEKKSKKNCIIN